MKKVYLFGAGASKGSDHQLPVMDEFFHNFPPGKYPSLHQFLERTFPGTKIPSMNIEDVITHLELSLEGFGARWRWVEMDVAKAHRECMDFIHDQLDYPPRNNNRFCEIHRKILNQCSPDDTFITLNYDLVIDHSLRFRNDTRSFFGQNYEKRLRNIVWGLKFDEEEPIPPAGKREGFFLKLHGSLDWHYCPLESCINHQQFFSNELVSMHSADKHMVRPGSPCPVCGTGIVPVIIPPGLGKSFEKYPKMGILWNIAFREIEAADELIFIGMSLPPSDYFLRWLLREATNSNQKKRRVTIANNSAEAIDRIKKLMGVEKPALFDSLASFTERL